MSECLGEDIVLNAVQQNPHKLCTKNFHTDWCCTLNAPYAYVFI